LVQTIQESLTVMEIDPIECPYYLVSRVTLLATSALKKGFAISGVDAVKPAYLGVLMTLWREDGLKAIDLGRRAGLEPSTMTGLLDRMERDKLLFRTDDPIDRRAHRIFLTPAGRDTKAVVLNVVDSVLSEIFNGIKQEDIHQTQTTLKRVLLNAQESNSS
jgi:DNA-binding MarR family transcriptional regulator